MSSMGSFSWCGPQIGTIIVWIPPQIMCTFTPADLSGRTHCRSDSMTWMSKPHCWKPCLVTEGSLSRLSITLPWLLLQIPGSFHFARFSHHPQMFPKSSHLSQPVSPSHTPPQPWLIFRVLYPHPIPIFLKTSFESLLFFLPLESSLLLSLSEFVHCSIIVLYLTANVHLQVNIYHVCPSGSGLPHPPQTVIFFSSIQMPIYYIMTLFLIDEWYTIV